MSDLSSGVTFCGLANPRGAGAHGSRPAGRPSGHPSRGALCSPSRHPSLLRSCFPIRIPPPHPDPPRGALTLTLLRFKDAWRRQRDVSPGRRGCRVGRWGPSGLYPREAWAATPLAATPEGPTGDIGTAGCSRSATWPVWGPRAVPGGPRPHVSVSLLALQGDKGNRGDSIDVSCLQAARATALCVPCPPASHRVPFPLKQCALVQSIRDKCREYPPALRRVPAFVPGVPAWWPHPSRSLLLPL